MRVAAIDCGTNSIRLLIAEAGPDGRMAELDRRLELVRLGQGVDATGEFHPDALRRTFAAVDDYAQRIRSFGCQRVRFVATSAARDAHNRETFFTGIRERLGVEVEIIPGDEEAALSFAGALAGVHPDAEPVLVIDIGGGSTELIQGGRDAQIQHAISLDMGSVRLRERFLHSDPPTAEEIAAATAFIDGLLDRSGVAFDAVQRFIGVAGTATSLSAIQQELAEYQRELVHGSRLEPRQIQRLAADLLATPAEQIEATTCLPLKRAEVICAGALILSRIVARVAEPMVVSESDILDALAMGLLG
ncbi:MULTISPECIES: Ppx/GppA phosphatase family protein [unclassified Luteococcus]|uniref:Ppx/GppA phosphatase family protein n=1 Tax=unclassified Luteococcus TaxID=2639923 RepID=UPI00313BACF7